MSELYKEAILEAKKLREVAETDARNKIIEAVSPIIKKMITKEAAEASKFLFGEEDIDPGMISDPMGGTSPDDLSGMMGGTDSPTQAPISATGELGGMPMPDEEGKITLDFQQLFSLGGGTGGAPSPEAIGGLNAQSQPMAPDLGAPGPEAIPPTPEAAPVPPIAAGIPGATPEGSPMASPMPPATPPAAPGGVPGEIVQPGAGATPAVPPEELPPEEIPNLTETKINSFKSEVVLVAEKIDFFRAKKNTSALVRESIKSKLFSLCESVDSLTSEGVISGRQAQIVENKLEFLFSKLNEATHDNSYREDQGKMMTTLKEFAAKLFEEDALGPATADKATAHAEKVSGIQPGVDLFKEGEDKADEAADMKELAESLLGEDAPASTAFGDGKEMSDAENKSPKVHDADALAKEKGAGIVGEAAPASTAFGDGSKATGAENTSPKVHAGKALADETGANTILEFDEKELREAIAKVRKENLARKIATVKEGAKGALSGTDKDGHLKTPKVPEGDQGSAKAEGGKNPALKNLKEETVSLMASGGDEGGSDLDSVVDAGGGSEGEVELTFQIDVDDLEALLSGGVADFIAEPSAGDDSGAMDFGGGDDIEVVDDAPEGGGSDDAGGLLMDKEEEEEVVDETAPPAPAPGKMPMQESKNKTAKNVEKTVRELKTQLHESQLLTAKALYVSKFAVRNDLTSKQKQKIAEYFDKAKTIAEAKETYSKIKKILTESTSSSNLSGSASKPTGTGSARILEESVQKNASDSIEAQRWMLLAGIKSKK